MTAMQMFERRQEDRWPHHAGAVVSLEGFMARLHDLSPSGARLECQRKFGEGEVLRLDLPWNPPVRATVLDTQANILRLRFETPVESW